MAAKPHASSAPSVKEEAHLMIDRFPDDVTWADAVHEFAVAASIALGVDEAERGEFASDDEVTGMFAQAREPRAG